MDPIGQPNLSSLRSRPEPAHPRRFPSGDGDPEEPPRDRYESLASMEDLDSEEEREEGERHERELLDKYPLWEEEEAYRLLDGLHERLRGYMKRVDLCYEFLPLDAATPFASSCPNGAIYFTRGLILNLTEEETFFFAAHELAHTELRHYASRARRLTELRQMIPAPIGSPARQRFDLAAVLAVRHQEEFEADSQAGQWVGRSAGLRALAKLHRLCLESSPESLQRPTHPPFEKRLAGLREGSGFPPPLQYLYSLLG